MLNADGPGTISHICFTIADREPYHLKRIALCISVAYWYQAEPHAPFPPLPPVKDRLPALQLVGDPSNADRAEAP